MAFYVPIFSEDFGVGDFSDFWWVSVIDQKVGPFLSNFLTNEMQPKLPQIVLYEQLVSSRQIYLPSGGY